MGKGWNKGDSGKGKQHSGKTGVKGKGKGQKASGWHHQHAPRDKSDPDWRPRRGGRKAAKQALLYARKYEQWLKELGIPDTVEESAPREDDESSGFPDFPGELERLRELDLGESIDVVVEDQTSGPSSGSGRVLYTCSCSATRSTSQGVGFDPNPES